MSRVLYRAARATGVHHLVRHRSAAELLICCYHGLRSDDAPGRHWLLLAQSRFEQQMRYLARHYDCVPLDEALTRLASGGLDRPTACVTFDDGYRSNITLGLPVLERLGIPAVVYLATGLIGTSAHLWTTGLELAFQSSSARVPCSIPLVGGVDLASLDGRSRRAVARRACEALKLMPDARRLEILAAVHAALEVATPVDAAFALLTWDEARLAEEGGLLTFGAHTVSHPILSRLPDASLQSEISQSIRMVGQQLRRPSRTFAYPNGRPEDFDERAAHALAEAGCTAGLSTIEGLNAPDADMYALRRVTIGADDSFDSFCFRASGISIGRWIRGRTRTGPG